MKITIIILAPINKHLWSRNILTLLLLSTAAFLLQEQSKVVETETTWPTKSKYLLSGPLKKKFPNPWSRLSFL